MWLRVDAPAAFDSTLRPHAIAALLVTIAQIALGGWTSFNYATVACPDFPTCQAQSWPPMDFAAGFDVLQRVGPNYLGGLLDSGARAAIHMTHRLGAVLVFFTVSTLAIRVLACGGRRLAVVLLTLLACQIGFGIANVELTSPLAVATARNATGALLLLAVVTVNYRTFRSRAAS